MFRFLPLALLFLLGGCKREQPAAEVGTPGLPGQVLTNQVSRVFSDLGERDVLVRVDDAVLTKADFTAEVEGQLAFQRAARHDMTDQQVEYLRNQIKKYVLAWFVNRQAMLAEARRMNVVAEEADTLAAEKGVSEICRVRGITRDAYARENGGEDRVAARVAEEALLLALTREAFKDDPLDISQADAETILGNIRRDNAFIAETNAVRRAALEAVALRISAGMQTFDPINGVASPSLPEPMTVELVEKTEAFGLDEAAVEVLNSLNIGEWSPLLEQEESFDLFLNSAGNTRVRVSMPKELGYREPKIAEIQRDVGNARREVFQRPWLSGLIRKTTIYYPNGVGWMNFDQ